MRTFTDNAGRTYGISVNTTTIKAVRSAAFEPADASGAPQRVDLLDIVDGKLIERLTSDPVLLVDVLHVLCREDAERQGVGPAEFGRAMAGDVIEHATTALLEELVSFSPNPRERAALRRVLDAVHRTREKARDRMEAWLDARLDKAMAEALASAGGSSGSAPASQASTPDR